MNENGGNYSREGFSRALVRNNIVDCGCTAKFSEQVRERPAGEEEQQAVV
jgi:hypothetical protein